MRQSNAALIFGVIALLGLHLTLGLTAVRRKSVTVDEIFHVTGGFFFNRLGDFRVHTDNGVLPQRLHALPATLAGAHPPRREDQASWRENATSQLSYEFFYASGNDHWPMLMGARIANTLFGVVALLLVFYWARRLAGTTAGIVALGMGVLSPIMLAHVPLATTDAAAAAFLLGSTGAYWAQLQLRRWPATLLSSVVFGLACVSKYSAVLLLPVFVLLEIAHAVLIPASRRSVGRIVLELAAHGAAAFLVIWACFGFRYSTFAPGLPPAETFGPAWDSILDRIGWQGNVLRWLGERRILPEAFLFGYSNTYLGSLSRGAYLAGDFSATGWWSFFPLTFLWKSSPAELLGFAGCVVVGALRRRQLVAWLGRLTPLVALAVVYGFAALTSHLNIGHRHLLPLYPVLFILVGVAVARLPVLPKWQRVLAGVAVGAQAVSAFAAYPHYLAYFNAPSGGAKNGWRLLVDSSLDWGQDLPALKHWLDHHNAGANRAPVFLSYFGSGLPSYYGLPFRPLPFVNSFQQPVPYTALEAGIYCVSATCLTQVYSPVRGRWTEERESEYQKLRALEPAFEAHTNNPDRRAELEREATPEEWQHVIERHALLRFARLCHYLRLREVDADAGSSILIYRLTSDEVTRATAGPLSTWHVLVESTAMHQP